MKSTPENIWYIIIIIAAFMIVAHIEYNENLAYEKAIKKNPAIITGCDYSDGTMSLTADKRGQK